MRKELKPKLLRILHDKFEKGLSPVESDIPKNSEFLISEIYIYVKKVLDEKCDELIQEKINNFTIHEDLKESYLNNKHEKEYFFKEFLNENLIERKLKLCFEYECLDMRLMADKKYKDILLENSNDHAVWYKYCLFKLREMNYDAAEEALWKAIELTEKNLKYRTLLCCFYVNRGRILLAKRELESILEEDKFSVMHNTFLALLYIYYLDRENLGNKFFNVSQRVVMRKMGKLPPKKEKPDLKYLEQLKDMKLSDEEQDKIWMDLIKFFSDNYMVTLTYQAIDRLHNKETYHINLIYASLEFLKGNYDESDAYLNLNLEHDEEDGDIMLRKALNSFMKQQYYEAEECIFKALKADSKLCDFSTLLRLGYIYINRESIEDAYTILGKACSLNPKSTLSWLGLAIASLKLDYLQEAQKALKMANILDPINADIWGYTILLGLKDERKIEYSLEILEKYLNLEIENLVVLNKVGVSLMNLSQNQIALRCFLRIEESYEENKDLIINKTLDIHKVYWLIGQLLHESKQFEEAVEYYERAAEGIEGEFNKGIIFEMRNDAKAHKEHDDVHGSYGEPSEEYSEGMYENDVMKR